MQRIVKPSVEPRRLVSTHSVHLSIDHSQRFPVEQDLLLRRLKDVKTGYDRNLCCMEGTRKSLLEQVIAWVTNELEQPGERNTYWIYGPPGIGKTSLAHSICASLHDKERLAGAFFCQRDVQELRDPRNIFPTLLRKLAMLFPPFRSIVAEYLRNYPSITSESMQPTLFLEFIRKLPRPPKTTLVFFFFFFAGNAPLLLTREALAKDCLPTRAARQPCGRSTAL